MNVTSHLRRLFVLALGLNLALISCTKKPTAPNTNAKDFPGQPFGLLLVIGDQQVELSWAIDNAAKVKNYRVYRREASETVYLLIDSTTATRYTDRLVRNGQTYAYQISAVSRSGAEGLRSTAASATPNVYALRINDGLGYTDSALVTLVIKAPLTTELMLIGNDSLFTGSAWQPYESTIPWTLTSVDGKKTVYAKFRDRDGNETKGRISASIILDTIALIARVTESTNGKATQSDSVIHFTLVANEPFGEARVNIDGGPQGLQLYDNGTNGDKLRDNGVYELDYVVPDDIEVTQARVRGVFTDRVGNVAVSVTAATKVTILKAPDPVNVFQPTPVGSQQSILRFSWTTSAEADFANYSIYRSTTPNFIATPGLLLDRVSVQSTTTYNDNTVTAGVDYYYQVRVFDTSGLASKSSNEVSGRVSANQPPNAVTLNLPQLLGDGTSLVQLNWSRSIDDDFAGYRILRATKQPIDPQTPPVAFITDPNTTVYLDNTVSANTTYFYQVYVFDQGGKSTPSNLASVTTARNQPPQPVTLATPAVLDTSTLRLSWSQNTDSDFASYRIYRSRTPGIIENQPPIHIINVNSSTTFTDLGLDRSTTYYYRVFVYDRGGLSAGSNEVQAKTK